MGEVKKKKNSRNPLKAETYGNVPFSASVLTLKDFRHSNDRLTTCLEYVKKRLEELKPGESLVVPGGWSDETGGHAVTYIVECEGEDSYAFVICNTGEGIKYHPASGMCRSPGEIEHQFLSRLLHLSPFTLPSPFTLLLV